MLNLFVEPLGLVAALRDLIAQYPKVSLLVVALGILAAFNFVVQMLPPPEAQDGRWYRGFFRAMHGAAFNFKYALRAKFPQYVPPEDPPAA